jgi:DNA-nicking Smr family endonuclease
MSRGRRLSAEEHRLWSRVARTVKPLAGVAPPPVDPPPASEPPPDRPTAKAAPPRPDASVLRTPPRRGGAVQAMAPQGAAPAAPDASGQRKVRRGKLEIDGRIDLHGMSQAEAERALARFLAAVASRGGRCALVVTGKGRVADPDDDFLTPRPGVMRRRLPEWLAAPHIRPLVSGYAPAHPKHGGAGAFYVLLRTVSDPAGGPHR